MPEQVEDRDLVLKALADIQSWDELVRSPQLSKFLNYIVTRTLDGDGPGIKAYAIAVDVFGRHADFDPQADPIVRVQARRLRSLLDQYYDGPGSSSPVRLYLPVGRYTPEFRVGLPLRVPAKESSNAIDTTKVALDGGITLSWFALAFLVAAVAALAVVMSSMAPQMLPSGHASGGLQQPSVTVFEFQNLTGDEKRRPMVAGLAIELVTDLQLFEDVTVDYAGSGITSVQPDKALTTDFSLTGIARLGRGDIQYSATLTDMHTGTVVWSKSISMDAREGMQASALDDISRQFSLIVGSSRGPLHKAGRDWASSQVTPDFLISLYACDRLFHRFRDSGAIADGQLASGCYARLPDADRSTGRAQAAMGILLAEAPSDAERQKSDRFVIAKAMLQSGLGAAPTSGFVWEQQGRLVEELGDVETARAAYNSSIQLNPANADVLASFARLLALDGSLDDSLQVSNAAAYGSPDAPPWYFCVPTLAALRSADYVLAMQDAIIYASADRVLGPVLAVVAAEKAGADDVVNRYLPAVLDTPEFRQGGIVAAIKARVSDQALQIKMVDGLMLAGVPHAAMDGPF